MRLSPPKKGTWYVALVLGAVAILSHYSGQTILGEYDFMVLGIALLLLLLASIFDWL
jgi:hypothetical protein